MAQAIYGETETWKLILGTSKNSHLAPFGYDRALRCTSILKFFRCISLFPVMKQNTTSTYKRALSTPDWAEYRYRISPIFSTLPRYLSSVMVSVNCSMSSQAIFPSRGVRSKRCVIYVPALMRHSPDGMAQARPDARIPAS